MEGRPRRGDTVAAVAAAVGVSVGLTCCLWRRTVGDSSADEPESSDRAGQRSGGVVGSIADPSPGEPVFSDRASKPSFLFPLCISCTPGESSCGGRMRQVGYSRSSVRVETPPPPHWASRWSVPFSAQ
jgi:hypothetical protein